MRRGSSTASSWTTCASLCTTRWCTTHRCVWGWVSRVGCNTVWVWLWACLGILLLAVIQGHGQMSQKLVEWRSFCSDPNNLPHESSILLVVSAMHLCVCVRACVRTRVCVCVISVCACVILHCTGPVCPQDPMSPRAFQRHSTSDSEPSSYLIPQSPSAYGNGMAGDDMAQISLTQHRGVVAARHSPPTHTPPSYNHLLITSR